MSPKIVFAAGSAFSGSTAFGNMLNNTGIGNYLGEVDNLFEPEAPLNRLYPCRICAPSGNQCKIHSLVSSIDFEKDTYLETLANIAFTNRDQVVIDGSKTVKGIRNAEFFRGRGIEISSIVLVKDPIRHIASTKGALRENVEYFEIAKGWLNFYWNLIRCTAIHGVPTYVLNTDELRILNQPQNNNKILNTLRNFLNSPDGDEYRTTNIFLPTHQIGGNERTLNNQQFKPENDERALQDEKLIKLAIMNTPGMMDLINLLGLSRYVCV
jgi:hypothetical protein